MRLGHTHAARRLVIAVVLYRGVTFERNELLRLPPRVSSVVQRERRRAQVENVERRQRERSTVDDGYIMVVTLYRVHIL